MPTPTLPSGRRPFAAAGVHYDGATKDLKLNADGQVAGVHPVDEGMGMSMLKRGSVKSNPNIGNTLSEIKYLGGPSLAEEVRARVMDAFPLSKLVSEGRAVITRITHQVTRSGLSASIRYVNLETADTRNMTAHEKRLDWYG